jgi:hypothetical protein
VTPLNAQGLNTGEASQGRLFSPKLSVSKLSGMSALGHKLTLGAARAKSALPPKADISSFEIYVGSMPMADVVSPCSELLQQEVRHGHDTICS